jgi:hypothetical protein
MTRFVLLVTLVIGLLSLHTPAHADVSCHQVSATGRGQDLGGGKTEAKIRGDRLLKGSTTASFVITSVVGTVASFNGVVLFDLKNGALALSVSGTFDVASGQFSATSTAMTGFGKFRGADGTLTLSGLQDLATGAFTETITGEVCLEH